MKDYSPFTPGQPVPHDLFVGRKSHIEEISRYFKNAKHGRVENVFLSGERGIGKSSLASYLCEYASIQGFLSVHVYLGGVDTLEELVRRIFEGILREARQNKWYDNIQEMFGKHIESVDLFGVSVRFKPTLSDLEAIVRNFPEALINLFEKMKDERDGLFIVLDDINGLCTTPEFANWYKSMVDHIATHGMKFPVLLMPVGLPEIKDALSEHQPSLMRIFRPMEISSLGDKEVENFFITTFAETDIDVNTDALEYMKLYSSGLPIMMQEIGEGTFNSNDDEIIDESDSIRGVIIAAESIGKKYLDPQVYNTIQSSRYISIIRKVGAIIGTKQDNLVQYISKKEIVDKLNQEEKNVFDNFIRKMRDLDIIKLDSDKGKGNYKFVNKIYPFYIFMESRKAKTKRNI